MKRFKIILVIHAILTSSLSSEHSIITLKKLEGKLSCTEQYKKDENEKIDGRLDKFTKCIKNILEIKINKNYDNNVQLGVFSKKKNAKNEQRQYNNWKKKINALASSKADIKEDDGKFFVLVSQKSVSSKDLKKKVAKAGWSLKTYIPPQPKITINIDNEMVRDNPDDRVKILKAKTDCYSKYKKNKSSSEFEECLKEEAINAIQIHALPNKEFCEKAKKNCEKGRKCQCIEKKVKGDIYYTVVETIESSKKDIIKKIKQKKSKPFKLKKPEVLILKVK